MKERTESAAALDVEALYRRYGPMVMRRCVSLLKDEDAAADAMQETFIRILRHRTTLNATYPSSLLYRIATNVSFNMIRSRRRRRTVNANEMLDNMAGKENTEERSVNSILLEQVFHGVRDSTRRIAEIHYGEHRTLEETAAEAGMSVSGVRKRLRSLRDQSLERAAR